MIQRHRAKAKMPYGCLVAVLVAVIVAGIIAGAAGMMPQMSTPPVTVFGPGPQDQRPRRCPHCKQIRWVLMGGGVWWCSACDGPAPVGYRRRQR